MDSLQTLNEPPPLNPAWLAYEQEVALNRPVVIDITEVKLNYLQECRDINSIQLSGSEKHLNEGLTISNFQIKNPSDNYDIQLRQYSLAHQVQKDKATPVVIYYHGGGLYVGDLDSEDLACRRICKELSCVVYSCDYRQLPESSPDQALSDALAGFWHIVNETTGPFVLFGSSSGGQLAAQVSQAYVGTPEASRGQSRLRGVLLRAPVTCDASEGGANLPPRFKEYHTSLTPAFYSSIVSGTCVDAEHRTTAALPLEGKELDRLPRHWIEVSTNDIYYSDGMCYAQALREADVEVKLDVVVGWPHTFWLKAPHLERAVKAEREMIQGMKWLMDSAE